MNSRNQDGFRALLSRPVPWLTDLGSGQGKIVFLLAFFGALLLLLAPFLRQKDEIVETALTGVVMFAAAAVMVGLFRGFNAWSASTFPKAHRVTVMHVVVGTVKPSDASTCACGWVGDSGERLEVALASARSHGHPVDEAVEEIRS